MGLTLDQMVEKGRRKLTAKGATISSSWTAAKPRMKISYGATPFGPTRKANYNAAIDAATHRIDIEKWATNWKAKMVE